MKAIAHCLPCDSDLCEIELPPQGINYFVPSKDQKAILDDHANVHHCGEQFDIEFQVKVR